MSMFASDSLIASQNVAHGALVAEHNAAMDKLKESQASKLRGKLTSTRYAKRSLAKLASVINESPATTESLLAVIRANKSVGRRTGESYYSL
jgi:hypothetical protein